MVSWAHEAGVVIENQDHPQDACPFARPFPTGFDMCPEFRPMLYLSSHPSYGQMKEVLSCQHLQTGTIQPGRYYPQCRVAAPTTQVHAAV